MRYLIDSKSLIPCIPYIPADSLAFAFLYYYRPELLAKSPRKGATGMTRFVSCPCKSAKTRALSASLREPVAPSFGIFLHFCKSLVRFLLFYRRFSHNFMKSRNASAVPTGLKILMLSVPRAKARGYIHSPLTGLTVASSAAYSSWRLRVFASLR